MKSFKLRDRDGNETQHEVVHITVYRALEQEVARLKNGIKAVLTENAGLADGENCTLGGLKKLVPEWEAEFCGDDEHSGQMP